MVGDNKERFYIQIKKESLKGKNIKKDLKKVEFVTTVIVCVIVFIVSL